MIIRPFNAAYLLLLAFAAGAVVLLWALLRGRSERCRAAVLIALCAVNIIGFFVYKGFCPGMCSFCRRRGSTGSTGSTSCRCSSAISTCS